APLFGAGPLFGRARLRLVLGAGFLAGTSQAVARRHRLGQRPFERRHLPAQLLRLLPFLPYRLGVLTRALDVNVRGLDIVIGLAAVDVELSLPVASLLSPGPLLGRARLRLVLGAGFLTGTSQAVARRLCLGPRAL